MPCSLITEEIFVSKELLQSIIGTFLRTVLGGLGTLLVTRGYITEADFNALVAGLILLLATVAWGAYQKIAANRLIQAALSLPANASIEEAKEKAKTGDVAGRIGLSIALLAIASGHLACATGRPVGDKAAIYSAQSAAVLNGVQDTLIVLSDAEIVKNKAIFGAHDKIASGLEVFYARVQAGGYGQTDTLAALNQVINDAKEFQNSVEVISDPAAKVKLDQVFFTLQFTLNSIKAVIEARQEPPASDAQAAATKLRAPITAAWWNEVILVVQNTALRMVAQSRMAAPQAWADTADILAEIHATNQARLAQ